MSGGRGHTPGPYLLSGTTIYALDETGGCNRFSCQVQGGYSYRGRTVKERTSDEEIAATALLFQAAPDLLTALNDLMPTIQCMERHGIRFDPAQVDAAVVAIARATGEASHGQA